MTAQCQDTIEEGYVVRVYDSDRGYADLVLDCSSEQESETINLYDSHDECVLCSEVIEDCNLCTSFDFGLTATCTECNGALVPDQFGQQCVM